MGSNPTPSATLRLRFRVAYASKTGGARLERRLSSVALAMEDWFRRCEMFYVHLIRSQSFPEMRRAREFEHCLKTGSEKVSVSLTISEPHRRAWEAIR